MDILVIGINHKTAPVELREKLSFLGEELGRSLSRLLEFPEFAENMILSTCNRVEIYATTRDVERGIVALKNFLAEYHGVSLEEFEKSLYVHLGRTAIRHIFRVASSLDSMVVGEPQILGQIKEAHNIAAYHNASGIILNKLLHRAFHVAKRVRTETKIGDSAVSISYAAVELAKKIFGALEDKAVMLLGAGEMAELAAKHLITAGAKRVVVASRTYQRAVNLAMIFNGEAIEFDGFHEQLEGVDIVISSTGAPHYILRPEDVLGVIKARKYKPMFFIDIAVPRDIDPEVNGIENVYLYDIDDLQEVVDTNRERREREARRAEEIVEEEVLKFYHWHKSLDVVPTVVSLKEKLEEIRRRELDKALSSFSRITEKERRSLESLTSAIIKKILHDPVTVLKSSDLNMDTHVYVDAVRKLFRLEGEEGGGAKRQGGDDGD
ncbi:MAG: glutamyl-tRNA reductase [Syntrophobacterales bacterium]|nr:MAG: glutamyl-tRNA reductase [Syntrophobacterales bacterium]